MYKMFGQRIGGALALLGVQVFCSRKIKYPFSSGFLLKLEDFISHYSIFPAQDGPNVYIIIHGKTKHITFSISFFFYIWHHQCEFAEN